MLYWGFILSTFLIFGAVYASEGRGTLLLQKEVSLHDSHVWAFLNTETSIVFINYFHNIPADVLQTTLVINLKNKKPVIEVIEGAIPPGVGDNGNVNLSPSSMYSAEIVKDILVVKNKSEGFFESRLINIGNDPSIDLVAEVDVKDKKYLLVIVDKDDEDFYSDAGEPFEVLIFEL